MSINRRNLLTAGAATAVTAGAVSAPHIARAQDSFRWRMTTSWPAGAPFYQRGPGSATDFADRVRAMSNGRLDIRVYAAEELIPAFGGFDEVSAGNVEMNHACSYYWSGQTFAAQYFTTVPFGMSFQGFNAWLNDGGGNELWQEVYEPFNLVGMPAGCTGVQMVGWFREPIETVEDLNGLNMRIPGLAGQVYEQVGVNVRLLPGGEIFPALERGVIDAAEWVGPYLDRDLGLQNAASHYYSSGWHEPSTTSEIIVNKDAYESLPDDLRAVLHNAAEACNLRGHTWLEAHNADALEDLVENHGVQVHEMTDEMLEVLWEATRDTLGAEAERDPMVKRVNDSYWAFKEKYDDWQDMSETTLQTKIRHFSA